MFHNEKKNTQKEMKLGKIFACHCSSQLRLVEEKQPGVVSSGNVQNCSRFDNSNLNMTPLPLQGAFHFPYPFYKNNQMLLVVLTSRGQQKSEARGAKRPVTRRRPALIICLVYLTDWTAGWSLSTHVRHVLSLPLPLCKRAQWRHWARLIFSPSRP